MAVIVRALAWAEALVGQLSNGWVVVPSATLLALAPALASCGQLIPPLASSAKPLPLASFAELLPLLSYVELLPLAVFSAELPPPFSFAAPPIPSVVGPAVLIAALVFDLQRMRISMRAAA